MELKGFLTHIFKHAPLGSLVRWGPLEQALFLPLDQLQGVAATGADLFFGPAPREKADSTREAVLGANVAWVDFDDTTRHPRPLLPPSFVVRSGGGFHLYWLLDDFYLTEIVEEINKNLIAHDNPGEGGAACWDGTRILRVPGTMNTKYSPPREVIIVTAYPERIYSPVDLQKLATYDPRLLEVGRAETRSERDWRLVSLLFSWGLSKSLVELSLLTYSEKAQEEGEHYLERTLERAAKSPNVTAMRLTQALDAVATPARQTGRSTKPLANFSIGPLAKLVGPAGEESGLQLLLEWSDGGSATLTATQRNFESRRAINQWLGQNQLGSRAWQGSDKTAYTAWAGMVEACPPKEVLLVKQAGRYDLESAGTRVFIYAPDKALIHGDATDADLGVAWTPQAAVPMSVEVDPTSELDPRGAAELISLTLQTYSPEVLLPALGWMAATPLKPVIEKLSAAARFPLLVLYGPKGAGKTSLLHNVLLPLVGMRTDALGADVSRFALLAHLGQYNALPAWIGEFRPSTRNVVDLQMYLRMAYDGHRAERGRPDQSVAVYELTAPIVLDGEALFTDAALRERCIALRLKQNVVEAGTPAYVAYERLLSASRELKAVFAADYLRWTLTYGARELAPLLANLRDTLTKDLPFGRLVNTAAIVLLGLSVFGAYSKKVGGPVLTGTQDAVLAAMHNTFSPGLGVTTAIDQYCEVVAHAYAEGQMWAKNSCIWNAKTGVLWFNVTMTLHWVRRFWSALPDRELVLPQLEDRRGLYIVGPERLADKGGGLYWGIQVAEAQNLGLDVPEPAFIEVPKPKGANE